MRVNILGVAAMTAAVMTIPVAAHHSTAMFDRSRTVTVEGTVKRFQFTNPHSWVHLTVPDSNGQPMEWALEMGGPQSLMRQGWTPKTLTAGMKVKAVLHPLREGKIGGQFLSITLPDGKTLGDANPGEEARPN